MIDKIKKIKFSRLSEIEKNLYLLVEKLEIDTRDSIYFKIDNKIYFKLIPKYNDLLCLNIQYNGFSLTDNPYNKFKIYNMLLKLISTKFNLIFKDINIHIVSHLDYDGSKKFELGIK